MEDFSVLRELGYVGIHRDRRRRKSMRKTLMSVAIVGVIGLLVMPGLGCGKQEVVETDVVADDAGDVAEVVTEEPAAEVKEEDKEAKKVEDADWKSLKQDSKAAKIDETAEEALLTLFAENPKTRELYLRSYGWAVFDNLKLAFGVSGGGGNGVAVAREIGETTYMKMGTVGVGVGLGVKKYQVVFFMQDSHTFDQFVDKGWQADAGAGAVAGKAGVEVMTDFVNGLAVYQLTEKGLMANADIAGTKYWKNKKLND
jgi:lipid-binding SYLF domain-containing protein